MNVLVTGGTGALAKEIVEAAVGRALTLRLTSRRPPSVSPVAPASSASPEWVKAELVSGEGLQAALDGMDAIIHTASDFLRADAVDVGGTRQLVRAAERAGVRHLIYISIVGIERIPFPYYRAKLAAETVVAEGHVPWTILRATQFHTLIDERLSKASRFPLVMPLPQQFLFQTVDTREVAIRLLDLAGGEAQQRAPDFGGPEVLRLGDMAREWRRATGVKKPVLPLPWLGEFAKAFREGRNTAPNGVRGVRTWEQWLARRYS